MAVLNSKPDLENLRVFLRIRPLLNSEVVCVKVPGARSVTVSPPLALQQPNRLNSEVYDGFSHVFASDSSQIAIADARPAESLVAQAMQKRATATTNLNSQSREKVLIGASEEPQEANAKALSELIVNQVLERLLGRQEEDVIVKSGEEDYWDTSHLLTQASPYTEIKFNNAEDPLNILKKKIEQEKSVESEIGLSKEGTCNIDSTDGERNHQIMQSFAKAIWNVLKEYNKKLKVADDEIRHLKESLMTERETMNEQIMVPQNKAICNQSEMVNLHRQLEACLEENQEEREEEPARKSQKKRKGINRRSGDESCPPKRSRVQESWASDEFKVKMSNCHLKNLAIPSAFRLDQDKVVLKESKSGVSWTVTLVKYKNLSRERTFYRRYVIKNGALFTKRPI